MTVPPSPLTDLIRAIRADEVSAETMALTLLNYQVIVPLVGMDAQGNLIDQNEAPAPLLAGENGEYVAVFTEPALAQEHAGQFTEMLAVMPGSQVVEVTPEGYGLMIMSPEGAVSIEPESVKDLAASITHNPDGSIAVELGEQTTEDKQ